MGQNPNFYQKFVLEASLTQMYKKRLVMLNSTPSCGLLSLISFPQGFLVFCHDFFTLYCVQCTLKQKSFYLLNLSYLASSLPYFFILILLNLLCLKDYLEFSLCLYVETFFTFCTFSSLFLEYFTLFC